MSSKIGKRVTSGGPGEGSMSRGARAVPPPAGELRELAHCVLAILDYITAHSDGTSELIDDCKPRLEMLLRSPSTTNHTEAP